MGITSPPDPLFPDSSFSPDLLSLFQIFDSIDEVVYVSDPDTYEVLYVNQAVRSVVRVEPGKKCYELFQKLNAPCPFCTNKYIFGEKTGKTHIWEFFNESLGRWYRCIDKAVPWNNNKMVRYEMAIDITDRKKSELENMQKAEDLALLNSLNEAANRGENLSRIISIITEETQCAFTCFGTAVYLLDDEKENLVLANYESTQKIDIIKNNILEKNATGVSISFGENSPYRPILEKRKPVIITDRQEIVRLMQEHTNNPLVKNKISAFCDTIGFKQVTIIPIASNGTIYGHIEVAGDTAFSASDLKRLEFLTTHFVGILKRKLLDESLAQSEKKYRILAESSNDAIYLVSVNGTIEYVNSTTANIASSSPEEMIGKHIRDISPGYSIAASIERIEEVLKTGRPLNAKSMVTLPDGSELWLDTNLVPVIDKTGKLRGAMGVSRNSTERMKNEAEKEKMRERLFEAEKMRAISVLAGGIAHDINNMLTAINSFAAIALTDDTPMSSRQESVEQIAQVVRRAHRLTDRLLGFSRTGTTKPVPCSINDTIDDVKKLLFSFIRNGVTISFNCAPALLSCMANRHKIEQVLMNLVMNARDAIEESGTIVISTENTYLGEEQVCGIPYVKPGRFVCLSIKDNGAGIDAQHIATIFEPFFTTKPSGKGTGLGLSVVKDIVDEHKGFIRVESSPGAGTEFKVFFPAVKENSA